MDSFSEHSASSPAPAPRAVRIALLLLLGVAAAVRLFGLDRIPPGLWYDEAIYALDGLEAATLGPRLFYTTENHMREPLYIWSLGAFFAAFGHGVWQARLVSALWGIAAVAAFWPVARRAFRTGPPDCPPSAAPPPPSAPAAGLSADVWALAALLAFAVFRWHVHFSRTIFRALLPSLFVLVVILLFSRWRERRRPVDAALAGAVLGAGMYTYLSFRLVPLLLALWIGWQLWRGCLTLRRDARQLAVMAVAALLVFAPLGIDWILHPDHFSGRTGEVSMFSRSVGFTAPDGTPAQRIVSKTLYEALSDLGGNALQVAGMWTFRGDHVGKHNLPYEPVFDWVSGLVFYAGLLWCLLNLARNEYAFLTLAWIAVFSLTSIFSFGAPNILRMQGAAPAAVLAYAFGLRWLVQGAARAGVSPPLLRALAAGLILVFAAVQLDTYFRRFPASPQVRQEFQIEMFAAPAESVRKLTERNPGSDVLVPEELASHPTFKFITARLANVRPFAPGADLSRLPGRPAAILLTRRSEDLARQAGVDHRQQVRSAPRARLLESFPVTVAGPAGQSRRQPWAELWIVP